MGFPDRKLGDDYVASYIKSFILRNINILFSLLYYKKVYVNIKGKAMCNYNHIEKTKQEFIILEVYI